LLVASNIALLFSHVNEVIAGYSQSVLLRTRAGNAFETSGRTLYGSAFFLPPV
jgi:hypothetical protein